MRRLILGSWLVVSALMLSAPAMAHVTTDVPFDPGPMTTETLSAGGAATGGLGPLVAAVAVAATLVARRRRVVAIACAALLLLVAFEVGVHSVHHLIDQPGGQCVIASASSHTGAVAVQTIAFDRPTETVVAVAVISFVSPTARPAAPDLGRAPPAA